MIQPQEQPEDSRPITTAEIARYCHVSHRTVQHWIASGVLKSYRTPGKHNRIRRTDFLDFLARHQMPIPPELNDRQRVKPRILVVDDDKGMTATLRRLLQLDGEFEVTAANDGFSAGEIFAAFKPHLVTLDIHMPQMDGFEVCRRIREKDKNVKIIVVSADMDSQVKQRLIGLGANDFLLKPFDRSTLINTIHQWIG